MRGITDAARLLALLRGDKTYRPERPCVHGHQSLRWTSNYKCIECERTNARQQYGTDLDREEMWNYRRSNGELV